MVVYFVGLVDKILSAHFWIPLSRLTYCAYLVHPIVLITYLGSLQTNHNYSDVLIVSNNSDVLSKTFYSNYTLNLDLDPYSTKIQPTDSKLEPQLKI